MEIQAFNHFTNCPLPMKKASRNASLPFNSHTQFKHSFYGQTLQLSLHSWPSSFHCNTTHKIQCAISRNKKEEIIEKVKQQLEDCYLIAGIGYKGFTVKQFQDFRNSLPQSTKLIVVKNRLVGKAIEGTPWEALKPSMKGMTAWLFVHSEEIPPALKPYRDFQKQNKLEENDYTGAVFEGKFYGPEEFKALETMPTRAEIYSKILGSLKSPAISLVGTLKAPARDLVFTLKAYVKKLEEEGNAASSS